MVNAAKVSTIERRRAMAQRIAKRSYASVHAELHGIGDHKTKTFERAMRGMSDADRAHMLKQIGAIVRSILAQTGDIFNEEQEGSGRPSENATSALTAQPGKNAKAQNKKTMVIILQCLNDIQKMAEKKLKLKLNKDQVRAIGSYLTHRAYNTIDVVKFVIIKSSIKLNSDLIAMQE